MLSQILHLNREYICLLFRSTGPRYIQSNMMSYIGCDDKIRELALGKVEALLLYKKKNVQKTQIYSLS